MSDNVLIIFLPGYLISLLNLHKVQTTSNVPHYTHIISVFHLKEIFFSFVLNQILINFKFISFVTYIHDDSIVYWLCTKGA